MPADGASALESELAAASSCGSAHVRPYFNFFRQPGEALMTSSSGPVMGAITSAGGWLASRGPWRAGGLAVPAWRGQQDVWWIGSSGAGCLLKFQQTCAN